MHSPKLPRLPLALLSLAASLSISSFAVAAPSLTSQTPLPDTGTALLSVPVPNCDNPTCWADGEPPAVQAVGLRRVYLNFEGVTLTSSNQLPDDATQNRTWMIRDVVSNGNTLTIQAFDRSELREQNGANSRQEIIDYTIQTLRDYHSPYNIEFTLTRPSSGAYHMVVFGGTCANVVGQSCAGIAPLDCNDASASNIVFAFPRNLRAVDLATTAAQELAHALGLSHTEDSTDIMFPSIQQSLPDGYGRGPIPQMDQGPCGNGTFQDSHQKLLDITGFSGQDGSPPMVRISSPSNGEVVSPGTPIVFTIEDESPISKVVLSLNNAAVETQTSAPFIFSIPSDAAMGQTSVELRATDDQGNEAGGKVNVVIGDGGEEACDNGQCAEGFTCDNGLCFPEVKVVGGQLGEACTTNEECASTTCATVEEEQRCSQTCDATNVCPDGFECLGGTACWPKTNEGGCSIGGSSKGVLSSLGLLFIALLFGGFRRRNYGY